MSEEATAPDFDSMSLEELGKIVPEQGPVNHEPEPSAPAEKPGADTPAKTTEKPAEGGLTPRPTDTVETLAKRLELAEKLMDSLNRQSQQWKSLHGKVDEIKAALGQREPKSALTPSEVEQKAAQDAAEKFLNDRIEERAKALIEREYGSLIGPIREQQLNQAIENQVKALGQDYKEMEPILSAIITSDTKAAENGDIQAKQRMIALASGNIENFILRGLVERSKAIQTKAATVTAKDANKNPGERMVKGGQPAPASGKKKLEDMTTDELDSMDVKELGSLLQRQPSVRG